MPHICLRRFVPLTLAILSVLLPMTAEAQLSRVGSTKPVIAGAPVARGTDTAYDPVNNVFLVVHAYGTVKGAFVNAAGTPLTPAFTISNKSTAWAHYPRVTYGNGKFLVVWHENEGTNGPNAVHARTVAYASPTLGPEVSLGVSNPSGSWWEAAPGVAYSEKSQKYLVVWQTKNFRVHGIRLDANGQKIGSMFVISGTDSRDPNVVWNPVQDEFGVSYTGWNAASATAHFARIRPSDGQILSRTLIGTANNAYITDIAYINSTGNYVMAYSVGTTRTAEITPTGQLVAHRVTSSPVGGYDGLSIAYNSQSETLLLVGHYTFQVGGLELNNRGAAISSPREVTSSSTQNGSFYPQVAAATNARLWSLSFSLGLGSGAQQSIASGSYTVPSARPVPSGLGTASGGGTGGVTNPPPSSGTCNAPAGLVCTAAGGWVPPTHPLAVTGGGGSTPTTPKPTTPTQPKPSGGNCTAPAGLVCTAAGGWVPPNHPLAVTNGGGSGGSTGGGGSTSTPTCGGTPKPNGDWACVGSGWVPTSHPDAPAVPACTGSQLSGRPVAGWYRTSAGGWVPPNSPYAKNAVCRG